MAMATIAIYGVPIWTESCRSSRWRPSGTRRPERAGDVWDGSRNIRFCCHGGHRAAQGGPAEGPVRFERLPEQEQLIEAECYRENFESRPELGAQLSRRRIIDISQ